MFRRFWSLFHTIYLLNLINEVLHLKIYFCRIKKKSNLSKRFVNVLSDVACILFMNLIVGYENTCIKKKVSEGPPPQWRHCTLCNEPFYLLCSYHDNTTTSSKSDTPHCTPGVGVPISSTSRVFLLPMSPLLLTIVEIFVMPKSAWFPNYRRYPSQILKNTILRLKESVEISHPCLLNFQRNNPSLNVMVGSF